MKRPFLMLAALGLLVVGPASMASGAPIVLLEVDFESNTGFTADCDGVSICGRTALSNTGPSPTLTSGGSQSGMVFFSLPNSHSASPTLTLDPVDLTGYTDAQLRISLAGTVGKWESDQIDGVSISINGTIVDEFLPDATGLADLESQLFSGADLTTQFQDFVYDLSALGPLDLATIGITIHGTSSTEKIGIDSIQIVATAPMPEPATSLLFGVGSLVVGTAVRRKARAS